MKRLIDDMISTRKHFHGNVTCLFDLPNEIFLMICRYLSICDIFHCFYTPSRSECRLHRVICDYYTKLSIGGITSNEFCYLISLFNDLINPLQPESLKLSNDGVSCLIKSYFKLIPKNVIELIFDNLLNLSLFHCFSTDLCLIDQYAKHLINLQYLHITTWQSDEDSLLQYSFEIKFDMYINSILFNGRFSSLATIHIETFDGLSLYKCLIPHENLRSINVRLHTIDDLYLLLNGLIPNVQKLIVELHRSRLLKSHPFITKFVCSQLIDFTLLDNSTEITFDDTKWIFSSMINLLNLTLSIRNTSDQLFSHGPSFEAILIKSFSNLHRFNYTMTQTIIETKLIEDFRRWPMNIINYEYKNSKWIHIYSLPWPSNRDDKRKLPKVDDKSILLVTSYVNITESNRISQLNLPIDIKLSKRINKLILNKETSIGSIDSIEQFSIRHLIVKRRLIDENEISILNHQFPSVKYLELLFPLEKQNFLCCFKTLFSLDDNNDKRCFWNQLIHFRTIYNYKQIHSFFKDEELHDWIIKNTDLKFISIPFIAIAHYSIISIWF